MQPRQPPFSKTNEEQASLATKLDMGCKPKGSSSQRCRSFRRAQAADVVVGIKTGCIDWHIPPSSMRDPESR